MESYLLWLIACIVLRVVLFAHNADAANGTHVKNLYATLLNDYDVRLRPVKNQSDPVVISAQFHLQEVMDFSEIKRTITVRGWFDMTWTDEYLVWDPDRHGGTNRLMIPPTDVWIPQIALKNSASSTTNIDHDNNNLFSVRVLNNGSVLWQPGNSFEAFCNVSIRYFPYDIQRCELGFVIWNYHVSDVELVPSEQVSRFRHYTQNSEWNVTDINNTMRTPDDFSTCVVSIRMARRPAFIITTTIAPLIMVAFLNPCVFLIPSKSGEKTSFILTLFLSFGVYMTVVSDRLPPSADEMSLLAIYIVTVLMVCVIMAFWSVLEVRVGHLRRMGCVPRCVYRGAQSTVANLFRKRSGDQDDNRDPEDIESNGNAVEVINAVEVTSVAVKVTNDLETSKKKSEKKEAQCRRDWETFAFFMTVLLLIHIIFFILMMGDE